MTLKHKKLKIRKERLVENVTRAVNRTTTGVDKDDILLVIAGSEVVVVIRLLLSRVGFPGTLFEDDGAHVAKVQFLQRLE